MLSGYPTIPQETQEARDAIAAALNEALTDAFNRADIALVGNVVSASSAMVQGLNSVVRGTNPPHGLPSWTPQSVYTLFDDTVRAAESEVYGLEDLFSPMLDDFAAPSAFVPGGGWSIFGPSPQMRGYVFNGVTYLNGGLTGYTFTQELDGRTHGNFWYRNPAGGNTPTREWSAGIGADGSLTLDYGDKLVTTDPAAGRTTT